MTKLNAKWPLAGVLTGLVILASGVAPGEAQYARRVTPMERSELREQLGLTEDQVRQLREMRTRQWQSMRETVHALREARRSLRQMALGEADEAAFMAKAAEVKELSGQVMEARARNLQEFARILTPEQRGKLRELRPLHLHRPAPIAS